MIKVFDTYKAFCSFIMNYEGELIIKKDAIYFDGLLIGKMGRNE